MDDFVNEGSEEDPNEYLKNIDISIPTSLKISNITRWNSVLTMINSFLKNHKSVNIILASIDKTDLAVRESELIVLKEFAGFLQIFQECTTILQGCKYSTPNLYLLFYFHIHKK